MSIRFGTNIVILNVSPENAARLPKPSISSVTPCQPVDDPENDNVDVRATLSSGQNYVATFYTLKNVVTLQKADPSSGVPRLPQGGQQTLEAIEKENLRYAINAEDRNVFVKRLNDIDAIVRQIAEDGRFYQAFTPCQH